MKTLKEIFESILMMEAMPLSELYEKYYSKKVDTFNDFILLNSIDPTATKDAKGKYLDFIINKLYINHYKEDIDAIEADSVEINRMLTEFSKIKGKDINQVTGLEELKSLTTVVKKSRSETKKDVEKIYDKDGWTVVIPKTEESAQLYGKNTKWCTSAKTDCEFKRYNDNGPLFIIIHTQNNEIKKYQFHLEMQQFMDEKDYSIGADGDFKIFPPDLINTILSYNTVEHKRGTNVAGTIVYLLEYSDYDISKLPILYEYMGLVLIYCVNDLKLFQKAVDAIGDMINQALDDDGNTVLMQIITSLDEKTLPALLKYMTKDTINAIDKRDNSTALINLLDDSLYYSPGVGYRMARILLEYGADKSINIIKSDGSTPLSIALTEFNRHKNPDYSGTVDLNKLIKLLLAGGAKTDINNTTALEYADYKNALKKVKG